MSEKNNLYILKEEDTNFHRIGITHDINYRIKTLKGGNHRTLELVYSIKFQSEEKALQAENLLHEILKEFSTHPKLRSWYDLSGNRYNFTKGIIETFIKQGDLNLL